MPTEKARNILSKKFEIIEEIYVKNIDFGGDVKSQLKEIFTQIKCPLNGSVPITVIVPGQSTLAVLLINYLSGIIGHTPSICLLEMDNEGFYIPTNEFYFNGNQIKSAGREFRQELWDKGNSDFELE